MEQQTPHAIPTSHGRLRDAKGRFLAKPPPLSKQQLGDLTAWTVFEEATPQTAS